MKLILFNSKEHKEAMIQMLISRGMDPNLVNDLPELGLIVLKDSTPIAAGFIRKAEGSYGIMDSYITNSEATSEDRDIALDLITDGLVKLSIEHKISKLIAFSNEQNIVLRSIKHGFGLIPHVLTIKVN